MKTNSSLRTTLLALAAFAFTFEAQAQDRSITQPGLTPANYGLLGQEYSGINLGYTRHVSGPPRALRSFGFISNRPTAANLDAAFKYDYTGSSALGGHNHAHRVAGSVAYYWATGSVKPFVEGDAGWLFTKGGGRKSDSFVYLVGGGVEIQVLSQLVITPFVNFQEAPHFNSRGWGYGAKATYRLAQEWSTTLSVRLDEDRNEEYRLGVNRHF